MKPETGHDRSTADAARPSAHPAPAELLHPARPAHKTRCDALASLLGDESRIVWQEVHRQFELLGPAADATLRRAAESSSPLARSRARTILLEREKRAVVRRLARYAARDPLDLERALFLLARYHTPRLDPRPYQRALDAMASEVARRARRRTDELQRAATLVEYLGGELDYSGSLGDFHHPDNIHLHRAIERRAGMPLTLCAIYLFVARRAGLRAALLPLPGHVMLRLYGGGRECIVDPYHRGQTRTEAECKKYLTQNGLPFHAAWLRDANDALLFRRQVMNLVKSSQMRGLKREVRELNQVLRVVESRPAASAPTA